MYLFTRSTRLASGHLRDGMEWALGITEKVVQITSLNVRLWQSMYSPAVGTLSWATTVESLAELEDANAKLTVDDVFVDNANRGAQVTTGQLDDQIAQFLHGGFDPSRPANYATVVRSQLANGSFERGMAVGIEVAERSTAIGGLPTSFLIGSTGLYGSVAWITGAESLRDLENAEKAVNADTGFIRFIDEQVSPCYLPGVTAQTMWQRVG